MKKLSTARQVIEHLGGLPRVCEITRANLKQAYNWPGRAQAFPACYYVVMTRALKRRDATAPARLWNQKGLSDAA
jgi:hypothetical protein